jgi:hypothetical protein
MKRTSLVVTAPALSARAGTIFPAGNPVVAVEGNGVPGAASGSYTGNQAAPLTLFQYRPSGTSTATFVSSLVLPQVASGTNFAISGEYGSSSEGTLREAFGSVGVASEQRCSALDGNRCRRRKDHSAQPALRYRRMYLRWSGTYLRWSHLRFTKCAVCQPEVRKSVRMQTDGGGRRRARRAPAIVAAFRWSLEATDEELHQ